MFKELIPGFLIDWYHFSLAALGAFLYRLPSRNIKVIGVTGTNGKSTVVYFISKILEKADFKIALVSSINFKIDNKEWPNTLKMTMPGRFKLQRFLRQAVKDGCQYALIEVTSEGIKQHRHRFINFDTAIFTNLTPEHIEAHGGFENYKKAKGKLFQVAKNIHIINIDDENSQYFLQFPAKKKITYGLEKGDINTKNTNFQLSLIGGFNKYNALAAIAFALNQGIRLDICQKALEEIKVIPGRMEEVISQPFKVIVDYAFTPAALQKVYETLSGKSEIRNPKSEMICVLGAAGGGRDKWKRPVLGELAGKYCQKVIITNEDPYNENPEKILDEISSGFSKITNSKTQIPNKSQVQNSKFYKILDRRKAIRKSLELAKQGDVVIITGKGCEPWICIANGKKIPWDDRQVVKDEFEKLNYGNF